MVELSGNADRSHVMRSLLQWMCQRPRLLILSDYEHLSLTWSLSHFREREIGPNGGHCQVGVGPRSSASPPSPDFRLSSNLSSGTDRSAPFLPFLSSSRRPHTCSRYGITLATLLVFAAFNAAPMFSRIWRSEQLQRPSSRRICSALDGFTFMRSGVFDFMTQTLRKRQKGVKLIIGVFTYLVETVRTTREKTASAFHSTRGDMSCS